MGLFVPKYGASTDGGGGGGSGTVTSVGLTVPADLAVAGSPITGAGTFAVTRVNQNANLVMAGPASGGAAAPGYRALVSADIPNNAANTSGNAATATSASSAAVASALAGTLAVGGGGTGATTLAAHGVLVGNGAGAVAVTAAGTAGQVLTSNGASANPTWQAAGGGLTNPLAAGSLGAASLQLVAAGDGLWQPAAHTVGVQANSLEVLRAEAAAAAVNYLRLIASATGTALQIAAAGTDSNVDISVVPLGTGSLMLPAGATATPALRFTDGGGVKTGFACDGSHNLDFVSGGSKRVHLDGNSGIVSLPSGGQLRFGSTADPSSSQDANLFRAAASQLQVSDIAGNPISIGQKYRRLSKTGNYTAVLFDSFSVIDNLGASGEVDITLPAAAVGLTYLLDVRAAQTLKAIANGTDTIRLGASVSAAGGNIAASAVGCYALLTGFAGGWDGLFAGTWTVT